MNGNHLFGTWNHIQLPEEWAQALGLRGFVALDKTPEGILVRPCPQTSWDEFFATGLEIGSAPPATDEEEELELTRDDYLFELRARPRASHDAEVELDRRMEISGRVQNGVVLLDDGVELPEGARVTVSYDPPVKAGQAEKRRIEVPLVRTGQPGTLHLTNDRIAEILEGEDLVRCHESFGQSTT